MAKKKRFTIGVGFLFDYLYENYSSRIFKSVQTACREYDVNFVGFEGGNSKVPTFGQLHTQKNSVFNLIDKGNIDGMIILAELIANTVNDADTADLFNRLAGIPVISIGIFNNTLSNIISDNKNGLREVIAHLIDFHKCRKIAFIRGPETSFDARQRFSVYKETLTSYGIPINNDLIVEGDFYSLAADAVKILLDERKADFEALVSSNDTMAIFAMKELQSRGIRVPEDVMLTGFDDIEECIMVNPRLTTIKQSFYDIGRESVKALLAALKGEKIPEKIVLPTKLVIRESCGCSELENIDQIISCEGANKKRPGDNFFDAHDLETVIEKELPTLINKINIRSWFKELFTILRQSNDKSGQKEFLKQTKGFFIQLFKKKEEINSIYKFAELFFNQASAFLKDKAHEKMIFSLWKQTLILIGLLEQDYQFEKKSQIKQKSNMALIINEHFIYTLQIDQLKEIILRQLPKFEFNDIYICLYDGQTRESARLFIQCNKNNEPPLAQSPFPANHLLPGQLNKGNRMEYMVAALYFKQEHLGYILLDITNLLIEPIYDGLATEISGAIKSAMLTKEINQYANQLEKMVKERTRQLEMANQDKTNFFVNIAHETKTPLTLIGNYLDGYIKKYGLTNELIVIKKNFDKLLKNMIYYLDTEKIELGKISYDNKQIIDLSGTLQNITLLFEEYAGTKDIHISDAIEENIFVMIDPEAIERVINNLLDNAVRYTKPGGKIYIILKNINDKIEFTVKDTGIGLSAEQKNNIFEPYYQVLTGDKNSAGIGMGLNIVKKIIDYIGAEIYVAGKIDEGTAITCFFPKYAAATGGKVVEHISSEKEPVIDLGRDDYKEGKYTVLFVEDNLELLYYLKENTKELFNVFYARNGDEALNKLKIIPKPNIIISDIMMEGMDGHRFFEELSGDKNLKDIPFIFLTARTSQTEKIAGLRKGAVDYISKPFLIDELLAKMNSIIKIQEVLKEKNLLLLGGKIYKILENLEGENKKANAELDSDITNKLYHKYKIARKEIEVISLLKIGLEYKEIGGKLHIAANTVKTYISRIYRKCNVNNKIELLRILKSF